MNMHTGILFRALAVLTVSLLAACAASYQMSGNALSMRSSMTAERAGSILAKYVQKQGNRGGMCVVGISPSTSLVNNSVKVSGAHIGFIMNYPVPAGTNVQGNVAGGTGTITRSYRVVSGPAEIDVSALKQIRLLEVNDHLRRSCSPARTGQVVVLRTKKGLPDQAEVGINTTTTAELEEVLAAVSYLSPDAGIKSGVGM